MYDENNKYFSRTEELKAIVTKLRNLACEIQIPIVLAAQMKNDVVSPLDVTIDNLGESKDIAMSGDTVIGLFNFGKLHPIDSSASKKLMTLISRVIAMFNQRCPNHPIKSEPIEAKPIPGVMYAKIIKRRFGISDIDEALYFETKTGWLEPNNEAALYSIES